MSVHEVSVLSDELKPRRTPDPLSLREHIPRPCVPDLSIIECSRDNTSSGQAKVNRPDSFRKNLSYNEWKRSGLHVEEYKNDRQKPVIANPDQSCSSAMPTATHKKVILDCIPKPCHKYGLSDSAPAIGNTSSYSDFSRRPTSAPVKRSGFGCGYYTQDLPSASRTSDSSPIAHHAEYGKTGPYDSRSSVIHPNLPVKLQTSGSLTTNPALLSKQTRCPDNDSHCRITPLKSVSFLEHLENINNSATAPHHCLPNVFPPQLDCCQAKSRPCCPSQNVAGFIHPCCSDSVCSHAFHSPCHLTDNRPAHLKSSSSHPSYDDLCKIVLSQNNELKTLQAQVEKLLLSQEQNRCTPLNTPFAGKDSQSARTDASQVAVMHEESTQTSDSETNTENNQKMSIGVMTSFIHAVAYSGKIGVKDMRDDVCRSAYNPKERSSCSDSEGSASLSNSSPDDQDFEHKERSKQCRDCVAQRISDKKLSHRVKQAYVQKNLQQGRKTFKAKKAPQQSQSMCSQVGSCSNPGVSAAISAVRGCQAVLASNTGIRLDESLTFNAGDLPTVPEQPVSPMSSIHVDLQDYRETTTDETTSSGSDEELNPSSVQTPYSNNKKEPHGWTFYNKVLGQVNQMLTEKIENDVPSSAFPKRTKSSSKPTASPKGLDITSKRVAFQAPDRSGKGQDLKELALRYLRENYPEELISNHPQKGGKLHNGDNIQEMAVYSVPATNMSFATFRYLERYNLLPENFNPDQYLEAAVNVCRKSIGNPLLPDGVHGGMNHILQESSRSRNPRTPNSKARLKSHQFHPLEAQRPLKGYPKLSRKHDQLPTPTKQLHQTNPPPSKILDITALRQQPKLL